MSPLPGAEVLLARLLADRIDRSGGPGACWPWIGKSTHPFGYGLVRVNGKTVTAARRIYEVEVGPIPEGQVVRHRCDNPPCCNPAHLELGSVADNNRDTVARGRRRPAKKDRNHQEEAVVA